MTNITVLSASSGSEISHSLKEAEHGLFSYYLMKGLGGKLMETVTIESQHQNYWGM
jgi:hypothetical protein